ncbi:hypothetical protein [Maricaulis sp.]|uniref:TolB family protein n=1 Tax=Maricaulis sp. TaxID=1486257 RepID=UPI0026080883|nr:hypothetical protein [Maricaulis sp.]
MRRLILTGVLGVLLIAGVVFWPRADDWLAMNTYDGETYRVLFVRPGRGEAPETRGCDAVWAYGAQGHRVYAVVLGEDGAYRPTICDPVAEEQSAPMNVAVYDSYAGFHADGRIVTASRFGDTIDLVILDPDGSPDRLTDDTFRNSDPDWSPDGRTILFRSNRSGSSDLWTLDLETGGMTRLTDDPDNDSHRGYGGEGPGRFSPNGRMIVWNCTGGEDRSNVCVMNANGSNPRRLTPGTRRDEGLYPAWHPSGTRIVFGMSDGETYTLYEIGVDGSAPVRIPDQGETSNLGGVWVRG